MSSRTPHTDRFVALFDIDGTLIEKRDPDRPHAGIRAMDHAGFLVTGKQNLTAPLNFAGATDLGIAKKMLSAAGVAITERTISDLLVAYAETLPTYLPDNPFVAIGDAAEAVESVRRAGGIVGLGTGNLKRSAFIKLDNASLNELFNPDFGGFGDDSEVRSELLAIGAERCDSSRKLPVVIIGDTPLDVLAARAIGATAVGVPHGRISAEDLRKSDAHLVLERLDECLGPHIHRLLFSR